MSCRAVGQTLLHNWFEEREYAEEVIKERTAPREVAKRGHKGILEIKSKPIQQSTTHHDSYGAIKKQVNPYSIKGKRALTRKVVDEVVDDFLVEKIEWKSVTAKDFEKEWVDTMGQAAEDCDQGAITCYGDKWFGLKKEWGKP